MATKVFFSIDKGVKNDKVIHRVRTTMGAPVDMSMYNGTLTFKKNYAASANDAKTFSMPVTFNANGDVRVTIEGNTAVMFPVGRFVYDIIATNDAGNTFTRICEGYVAVDPSVGSPT